MPRVLDVDAMYAFTKDTEIIIQPFGSFIVNKGLNHYDVLNEKATGIALQFCEEKKLEDVEAWAKSNSVGPSEYYGLIGLLIKNGYLSGCEWGSPRISYIDDAFTLKATRAEIEITNRCNLSCKYCYAVANSSFKELSAAEWQVIIDGMVAHGLRAILFSGGEPFIHPEFLNIVEHASEKVIIEINTNGTLITPEIANKLSLFKPKLVQVSLDSPTAEYHDSMRGLGSHALAVSAIRALVDANVPTQISMVLTSSNMNYAEDMRNLASKLGASLSALPITRSGSAADIPDGKWESNYFVDGCKPILPVEPLRASLGFEPLCQVTVGYVAVSHKGYLMPCNMGEHFFTEEKALVAADNSNWWNSYLGNTDVHTTVSSTADVTIDERAAFIDKSRGRPCALLDAIKVARSSM